MPLARAMLDARLELAAMDLERFGLAFVIGFVVLLACVVSLIHRDPTAASNPTATLARARR